MYNHTWMIQLRHYGSQIVTLSGDQNEVFESLVLHFLLLTANFRKSNRQTIVFFFNILNFTVWLLCILKLFHLGEDRNITIEAL